MASDRLRDTAWREVWPLADLPAGCMPRWGDRAHDKSGACRERILLFVHATRLFCEMRMQARGISAEKRVGDENGSVNGENGNEIKNAAAKWRGAHDI